MYQKIQGFVRLIKSRLGILILLEQLQFTEPNRYPSPTTEHIS